MNKRAGSLAMVCSVLIWAVAPVWASQGDEAPEQALPQACFDTANTSAECQILFRYAELLGFGNIPDYVGFVESKLAEARDEFPFPPLRETAEFERYKALLDRNESPSEAMQLEMAQFLSHRYQIYAEFRHAQDWTSLLIQDALFNRLIELNAQLLPELDTLAAIEKTFLQADSRLPDVFRLLTPISDGDEILVNGAEAPQILTWLASSYGLDDEAASQALLLQLVSQHRYGGSPFDLTLLDQLPGIGALRNMPVESPIVMTETLRNDNSALEQARSTHTTNVLQNTHFNEPLTVNILLSLLAFAEGLDDLQPRIPYAPSDSLIDSHFYLAPEVFAQLMTDTGNYTSANVNVIAAILALRLGVNIPVVGSRLVQLEDASSGNFLVVELTPVMSRLVFQYAAGYEKNEPAGAVD